MRITCEVEDVELENDNGYLVSGVCVTCSRCDDQEEAFGTSGASVRSCLVRLRENCSMGESNFYVAKHGEDDD